MLDYGLDRARELIRKSLLDKKDIDEVMQSEGIDAALDYFDRVGDIKEIREAMKNRFAVGITRDHRQGEGEIDLVDREGGFETYRKGDVGVAIDQGHYETLTTGIGARIVSSLANLWTAENQKWSFLSDEDEPAEDAEAIIKWHREKGSCSTALVSTDWIACSVNGAMMFVDWVGGHLKYYPLSPSCVYALYHREITDDGETRAVDKTEIEDATCVVIRLADGDKSNPLTNQYLAIFGRSELYPYGRRVVYSAIDWKNIPEQGTKGSVDYYLPSGEIGNPLSWVAAQNKDKVIPEYPIIVIDGGFAKRKSGLVATSDSLFSNAIEIDIAASRLLKDSLRNQRGTEVLLNEKSSPLPKCLDGPVSLRPGQTLQFLGHSAGECEAAMRVWQNLVISVGSGYNVPDYQIVGNQGGIDAASGVSLLIRTQPMLDFRRFRIELNKNEVARLFEIERWLITSYDPANGAKLIGVKQSWDPGTLRIPEDRTEMVARIKAAQDAGYIDYVAAVREMHNLSTDMDAMALIDSWAERKAQYPGQAVRQISPPIGLQVRK